jgi:exopolyphosphatase / guanosine-5'-triphosphate,3'-diphosphate pyrophosphatase
MKISVIDVGTKSIKHHIFDGKKEILLNKDSTIKLGEDLLKTKNLNKSKIKRSIRHIKNLLELNKEKKMDKTILIGTDALRKANNANQFVDELKIKTGLDIEIISHEKEAELLGKSYQGIINKDFAVVDMGGGSTELVIFIDNNVQIFLIPFGVNKLYQEFMKKDYSNNIYNNKLSWEKLNEYINIEIDKILPSNLHIESFFLNGTLRFMQKQNNLLNTSFLKSDILNHPIKMNLDSYQHHINTLLEVGVDKLRENFLQDPGYADNFAIGQSVYYTIAKKLHAKSMYPSEMTYTQGLVK